MASSLASVAALTSPALPDAVPPRPSSPPPARRGARKGGGGGAGRSPGIGRDGGRRRCSRYCGGGGRGGGPGRARKLERSVECLLLLGSQQGADGRAGGKADLVLKPQQPVGPALGVDLLHAAQPRPPGWTRFGPSAWSVGLTKASSSSRASAGSRPENSCASPRVSRPAC